MGLEWLFKMKAIRKCTQCTEGYRQIQRVACSSHSPNEQICAAGHLDSFQVGDAIANHHHLCNDDAAAKPQGMREVQGWHLQ